MKNIKTIVIAAVMALVSTSAFAQVPSVEVEDIKGNVINTSELLEEETPMVISFWATTCKPCIRELDAIYEALPDWEDEVGDFEVVAVSTDDNRFIAKARSMASGRGWAEEFTCIFDKNQDLMRAMNVTLTPQVFVVDAKGKIIYSHTGYAPGSENEILKALKSIAK